MILVESWGLKPYWSGWRRIGRWAEEMEGVDNPHRMLDVEGRRDENMSSREAILEKPECV